MVRKGNSRSRSAGRLSAIAAAALLAAALPEAASHAQEPVGGTILDRRGRPLAESRGGQRVYPAGPLVTHVVTGVERAFASPLASEQDVMLTLDLGLQKVAYGAVAKHEAAAVVVVEVDTGRILALVSTPAADPIDRAVGREYRPASTYKLVTAVAGLETGALTPDQEVTCTGHRMVGTRDMLDMGVHGTLDFIGALQHSCNVYFWSVGERVGVARLAQVARDFGFGAPTGLGIGGDVAGHVPDAAEYTGRADRDLYNQLQAVIGLADVRASVLQVAMAYAALANGGRLYQPQIVRRVRGADGRTAEEREPILRRHVSASHTTLDVIRRGLFRAVNRRGGTAFAAKNGVVKMVGKTGTAPLPSDPEESHAWFAGWAPADHPKIAIVVLVENGGIGGAVAAPVARDIIDAYFIHAARAGKAKAASRKKTAQARRKYFRRRR